MKQIAFADTWTYIDPEGNETRYHAGQVHTVPDNVATAAVTDGVAALGDTPPHRPTKDEEELQRILEARERRALVMKEDAARRDREEADRLERLRKRRERTEWLRRFDNGGDTAGESASLEDEED